MGIVVVLSVRPSRCDFGDYWQLNIDSCMNYELTQNGDLGPSLC